MKKKQLISEEVKKLQKMAGIVKKNLNEAQFDDDDDEDFEEDELPPINKAELVSFIRQNGPKPTGAAPSGEYNVILAYSDYPSIPDSYMTGAMDVFMCVVKACGGKAKLNGTPSPEQNYTVMGCSFEDIQAAWDFLASDTTYETAGDNETIVQANGCAQTWQLDSGENVNEGPRAQKSGLAKLVMDTGAFDEQFMDYLRDNNITFKILQWTGPGGGNPEVEYYGDRAALEAMIDGPFDSGDAEQNQDYKDQIK